MQYKCPNCESIFEDLEMCPVCGSKLTPIEDSVSLETDENDNINRVINHESVGDLPETQELTWWQSCLLWFVIIGIIVVIIIDFINRGRDSILYLLLEAIF